MLAQIEELPRIGIAVHRANAQSAAAILHSCGQVCLVETPDSSGPSKPCLRLTANQTVERCRTTRLSSAYALYRKLRQWLYREPQVAQQTIQQPVGHSQN